MAKLKPTDKTFCPECNTLKKNSEFYLSNNKEKYPTGRLPICKRCRTMMVDNWKEETFIDILEECDVPFIPQEWNKTLEKYGQDPSECSGATIIGRYLSKMKLSQYNQDRWADSQRIQDELDADIRESMEAQGFDENVIEQALIDSKKYIHTQVMYQRTLLCRKKKMKMGLYIMKMEQLIILLELWIIFLVTMMLVMMTI